MPSPTSSSPILRDGLLYGLLTALAIGVQGYHPGLEDDAFYLAAIRRDLDPSLFPHDADFFRLQFQATIFDRLIAWSARLSHAPLDRVALVWQFAAIFLILWGCGRIAAKCFGTVHARWAAVGTIAALLTIPVAGTGLLLVDQYLNPRTLATAAIVWAIAATLDRRFTAACILLAAAASVHVIMAAFGASFCLFLAAPWPLAGNAAHAVAMAMPLGWLFAPSSAAWERAAQTRSYYFPQRWEWYEWLGVIAPLAILWGFAALAERSGSRTLAHVARRTMWFGWFQLALGLALLLPPQFARLRPFEPMRYLHLVYLFLFLLGGGLAGQYALKTKAWRWAALFLPLCAGMLYAQLSLYPDTPHMEWPGANSPNEWVRAFRWIRDNTPRDSLFALDPRYMDIDGEDSHGFRALAERSVLADDRKDPGMAARVPPLAVRWAGETDAQSGWRQFKAADFARLKREFGVGWVVLQSTEAAGLDCPWKSGTEQNKGVLVCRIR